MDMHDPDSHPHPDLDHTGPRHRHGYGHQHGVIDPAITETHRGMWALKWSFVGLLATALLQLVVVVISGSVALFADALHNLADAATAIPLAIAFALARLKPSRRFPYGYGRVEDLAGVVIVATILTTALIGGYESLLRLFHPQPVGHLWAVAAASLVGFLGNEAVALLEAPRGYGQP
jgi:cation diffusion facilitator family transporter